MLLARSVGSMGMALPAFLGCRNWRTDQQARGAMRRGCRADSRPSHGKVWTEAGSGRLPPSRWLERRSGTTRTTVRLPLPRLHRRAGSARLAATYGGYTAPAASGSTVAADALRRAGWPSPRFLAPTARGCSPSTAATGVLMTTRSWRLRVGQTGLMCVPILIGRGPWSRLRSPDPGPADALRSRW